mmetsp:Transcript_20242/g.44064  ORF Transcript_20242/g.44064 Transcript_20242/m.44064 type:complete len:211 (-) Transcript_20242:636-1268(-)
MEQSLLLLDGNGIIGISIGIGICIVSIGTTATSVATADCLPFVGNAPGQIPKTDLTVLLLFLPAGGAISLRIVGHDVLNGSTGFLEGHLLREALKDAAPCVLEENVVGTQGALGFVLWLFPAAAFSRFLVFLGLSHGATTFGCALLLVVVGSAHRHRRNCTRTLGRRTNVSNAGVRVQFIGYYRVGVVVISIIVAIVVRRNIRHNIFDLV